MPGTECPNCGSENTRPATVRFTTEDGNDIAVEGLWCLDEEYFTTGE